jgi:uncharacterized protein
MMIDVNVNLSRWPFRRLPSDEPRRLVQNLQASGVTQAWAGSFDGLFHKDIGAVNARLAEDCQKFGPGLLRPFGTVNPMLPDWHEDLRRCHEDYGMPGVRLHPNYHSYGLDSPVFAELLELATDRGLIVQLAVRMEDPRTQHPLMQVPDVEIKELPRLSSAHPKLRLILLNSLKTLRGDALTALAETGQVYFEIGMLEGVGGISNLLHRVPIDRVLLGSHFPLFVLESALLKLRESDLRPEQIDSIAHGNTIRILDA